MSKHDNINLGAIITRFSTPIFFINQLHLGPEFHRGSIDPDEKAGNCYVLQNSKSFCRYWWLETYHGSVGVRATAMKVVPLLFKF
jgi:hypothetical protein